jgi:hypothetical protein
MTALGETLLTAACVSGLTAAALAALRHAPPGPRFAIAAAGLAAWLVPWGSLRVALPAPSFVATPVVAWLDPVQGAAELAPAPLLEQSAAFGYVFALTLLVGALLFVRDCIALRRCVDHWRRRSRPADELRARLPPELAVIAADIRLVEGSAVAAVTGLRRPTVWLGDRLTDEHLTLALSHEMWHVRARDPKWLVLIAAVRRAYWWNPLVAHLARQAVLMLESACDHRCAAQLGKDDYRARLASLLLAATAPAPRLVATAGNFDVQRLRLLGEPLRWRSRDRALLAALAAAATAPAAIAVVDRTSSATAADLVAAPGGSLPATPAGEALSTALRAVNGGDSELLASLLGAYTPQELSLPLPPAPAVRVIDVLRSEPLRIEYVVESAYGMRHVGELAVAASGEITATRLRPLP